MLSLQFCSMQRECQLKSDWGWTSGEIQLSFAGSQKRGSWRGCHLFLQPERCYNSQFWGVWNNITDAQWHSSAVLEKKTWHGLRVSLRMWFQFPSLWVLLLLPSPVLFTSCSLFLLFRNYTVKSAVKTELQEGILYFPRSRIIFCPAVAKESVRYRCCCPSLVPIRRSLLKQYVRWSGGKWLEGKHTLKLCSS